jgi:hypothetical protein
MTISQFQTFVRTIGETTGVAPLEADEEGYLALRFDEVDLHLQYEDEAGEVVLFTRLGAVEGDRTEDIAMMLLGANLFWQGTKGATFSIEPATGHVFLADRRALEHLRTEDAVRWIERFHEVATHWGTQIADANRGGPTGLAHEAEIDAPDEARDTAYAQSFIRA